MRQRAEELPTSTGIYSLCGDSLYLLRESTYVIPSVYVRHDGTAARTRADLDRVLIYCVDIFIV